MAEAADRPNKKKRPPTRVAIGGRQFREESTPGSPGGNAASR